MSTVFIEVVTIDDVRPHTNADRLEIVVVRGATVCSQKGAFTKGQKAIYFPPGILIPQTVAEQLGVANHLKDCRYPGDLVATACRVAGCKLRGEPSFGFLVPLSEYPALADFELGTDVNETFGGIKYEPPEKHMAADARQEVSKFHRYTDIDNYLRHPGWFKDGTPVRITEKIHGTNSRVGLIGTDDGFEFMAGSNKVQRKRPDPDAPTPLYWQPLEREGMLGMLSELCDEQFDVVVFGEIYGLGIQDMDYGTERGYRVFDITINGQYMDWVHVKAYCDTFGVETVPLLYEGPFSHDVVLEHTYGPTTLASKKDILAKFKDREGCVITPLEEVWDRGRLILKSISADYLDRKGAQDNA